MPRSRTSSAVELLVSVDRERPEPLYRQLEQELRDSVRGGRLPPDTPLPSTRALADALGITRGVAVAAYEQLTAEGYLVSRPGGATRVARVPGPRPIPVPAPADAPLRYDFRAGRPDLGEFPRASWLRSLRRVVTETPAERLGYLDGAGMPELRSAMADYLGRARGVGGTADDIVVTAGFAQALHLVARALRSRGARRVAVEDPWHPEYRAMLAAEGLQVVPVPVDDDGIDVARLATMDADAAVVTPAHGFPSGAVTSPERRAALIDWADRRDATLIEDDYDAEFRYDRLPVGAMQGLCADRVVYAGTASKILAPGLRLGWIVVPRRLRAAIRTEKLAADQGSSALDQLALADFVASGELDRHLRRMRHVYRRRRDALLAALERHLPGWTPSGTSAGLHLLAWLPPDVEEASVVSAAEAAGIGLTGVSRMAALDPKRCGIVFGYGAVDEAAIGRGVAALARALAADR